MTCNFAVSSSASSRGWGPGWPNCQSGKMDGLEVNGADFPSGVHEDIHELVTLLLEETERRGYRLHTGWCWGFACRPIKNPDGSSSSTPSNHSWGLAIDINAPTNPNTSGPLVTNMPPWMPKLWNDFCFRWGGDYRKYGGSTVDPMHYEFWGTPRDAQTMTERARREFGEDDQVTLDKQNAGYQAYMNAYKESGGIDPGPAEKVHPDWSKAKKEGWKQARFSANNPKVGE